LPSNIVAILKVARDSQTSLLEVLLHRAQKSKS
jgi:hypothetical protein